MWYGFLRSTSNVKYAILNDTSLSLISQLSHKFLQGKQAFLQQSVALVGH